MISVVVLFNFFILVDCFSVHKKKFKPLSEMLNHTIPNFAPFNVNERENPFNGLDRVRKIFMQNFFSGAFYEKECYKKKRIVIKPIYFWPGQRVDLPCRFCSLKDANNGQIKYWKVLRSFTLSNEIDRLHEIPESNWMILNDTNTINFRSDFEGKVYMPLFVPTNQRIYRYIDMRYNFRQKMNFYQRDGKLKIVQSEASAYGLYRCFDHKNKNNGIEFLYYLIPILPLLISRKMDIHRYECAMGRFSVGYRFAHMDSNHRFRIIPPTTWNNTFKSNNFCARTWGGCKNDVTYKTIPMNLLTGDIIELQLELRKEKNERRFYNLNLKVFLHWSPWSKCDENREIRTRQGYCYIKKTDPSIMFNPNLYESKILEANSAVWITGFHKLLETVDEFRQNGIPLFSGILTDLLTMNLLGVSQCVDFNHFDVPKGIDDNYNSLWQLILQPIADLAPYQLFTHVFYYSQNFYTPCFYYNYTFLSYHWFVYAHPVNQNEKCEF